MTGHTVATMVLSTLSSAGVKDATVWISLENRLPLRQTFYTIAALSLQNCSDKKNIYSIHPFSILMLIAHCYALLSIGDNANRERGEGGR